MSIGFQVIGASGAWQVDDTFASLALRAKGTSAFGPRAAGNKALEGLVVVTADTPIVAIRADFAICPMGSYPSGSQTTFRFGSSLENKDKVFEWWHFDRPIDRGSNTGLVVRDAAGRVTFDGFQKYTRVVSLLAKSSGQYTGSAGAKLAYAFTRIPIVTGVSQLTPGGPYTAQTAYGAARASGSTVFIDGLQTDYIQNVIPPDAPYPNNQDYELLIFDVTNY